MKDWTMISWVKRLLQEKKGNTAHVLDLVISMATVQYFSYM